MKTSEMTVDQLRKLAQELGIKNTKKYKKDALIAEIEKAQEEIENEVQNEVEESSFEESEVENEETIEEVNEISLEQRETTENEEFENDVEIKEESNDAQEIKLPKGTQSIQIYNEILKGWGRKNFSLYRLTVIHKDWSYTNVHRVWKLYIKPYGIENLKQIKSSINQ